MSSIFMDALMRFAQLARDNTDEIRQHGLFGSGIFRVKVYGDSAEDQAESIADAAFAKSPCAVCDKDRKGFEQNAVVTLRYRNEHGGFDTISGIQICFACIPAAMEQMDEQDAESMLVENGVLPEWTYPRIHALEFVRWNVGLKDVEPARK